MQAFYFIFSNFRARIAKISWIVMNKRACFVCFRVESINTGLSIRMGIDEDWLERG